MRTFGAICLCVVAAVGTSSAGSKPHAVALGKWSTVKLLMGDDETTSVEMKIRPLLIDGRVKEFTTGPAHDVTDRIFVVQRAYRLNDLLPQESGQSRWQWERGGWLLVDRSSGRVQTLALPAFDAYYSQVSWFRDYAAYCGVSDDFSQRFALVVQLGRRKPLLKKTLGTRGDPSTSRQPCSTPAWSRGPARVTFDATGESKFMFTVRSQAVDLATEEEDEGEN